MLNKLSKNQYVKITKNDVNSNSVEYGVVLSEQDGNYDIMSIGFENRNGKFLEYPPNVDDMVQNYTQNDALFDEVKENDVRRKMNLWMENNYKR